MEFEVFAGQQFKSYLNNRRHKVEIKSPIPIVIPIQNGTL
jgi:hypothetical protein